VGCKEDVDGERLDSEGRGGFKILDISLKMLEIMGIPPRPPDVVLVVVGGGVWDEVVVGG